MTETHPPAPPYILAHDLGTTGNKANLFDVEGRLVSSAFVGYETAYPRAGWAEQDADDWWRAVVHSTQTLLSQPGIQPGDVAVVSLSAQMMACLAVDAAGAPSAPRSIWADQRATAEAEQLRKLIGEAEVYRRTGHRVSAAYTGPQQIVVQGARAGSLRRHSRLSPGQGLRRLASHRSLCHRLFRRLWHQPLPPR